MIGYKNNETLIEAMELVIAKESVEAGGKNNEQQEDHNNKTNSNSNSNSSVMSGSSRSLLSCSSTRSLTTDSSTTSTTATTTTTTTTTSSSNNSSNNKRMVNNKKKQRQKKKQFIYNNNKKKKKSMMREKEKVIEKDDTDQTTEPRMTNKSVTTESMDVHDDARVIPNNYAAVESTDVKRRLTIWGNSKRLVHPDKGKLSDHATTETNAHPHCVIKMANLQLSHLVRGLGKHHIEVVKQMWTVGLMHQYVGLDYKKALDSYAQAHDVLDEMLNECKEDNAKHIVVGTKQEGGNKDDATCTTKGEEEHQGRLSTLTQCLAVTLTDMARVYEQTKAIPSAVDSYERAHDLLLTVDSPKKVFLLGVCARGLSRTSSLRRYISVCGA